MLRSLKEQYFQRLMPMTGCEKDFNFVIFQFCFENMTMVNTRTYIPSNFTLTVMESFAKSKNWRRSLSKQALKTQSESIPEFAKKSKITFDKQNLLEQIRKEKQRALLATTSNCKLKRVISRSKIRMDRNQTEYVTTESAGSANYTLKRQLEQLVGKIKSQAEQIREIKSSKKYNRYLELLSMKDVYLEQIQDLKLKVNSFKHEIREKRRIKRSQKVRNRQIVLTNKALQNQIQKQNSQIIESIETVCEKIMVNKEKTIHYEREKQRLLRDIEQLQRKTGKVLLNRAGLYSRQQNAQKINNEIINIHTPFKKHIEISIRSEQANNPQPRAQPESQEQQQDDSSEQNSQDSLSEFASIS